MSNAEGSQPPRRSQREKSRTQSFAAGGSSTNKRKRQDGETDDEGLEPDIDIDIDERPDNDDADEEYRSPVAKPKTTGKAKGRPKGPPTAKKPRAANGTAKGATRKGKKAVPGDAFDAEKLAKETKISSDNFLFNAIMNPNAALQATAEDFLDSLAQTPGPALADLINCVFRACGCNEAVDADEVMDYDGVVDALDNFTESLKQDDSPIYPITSKLPIFKRFRRSLSEFLDRLVVSSAELGLLYTSELLPTLQTWVIAMSSSQIRSFRHTATVVALEVQTALCDVAAGIQKEMEVINRQRDGERKKAKGASSSREKEFAGKAAEVKDRRTKMTEFLKEFFDGVFVHRYRDLDPDIRADCVQALGLWLKKHPSQYIDGTYLRYIGWVLSDRNTHVRLEAVKSLQSLYSRQDFLVSLTHFTERFKPRLVEMATRDVELPVRVAVIQVLSALDGHGLLEEAEQEKLCHLVFDKEAKVRKAVSGFVRGVWEEAVEERMADTKLNDKERGRVGVKALAALLVQWGRTLDSAYLQEADAADNDGESSSQGDGPTKTRELATLLGAVQKGRATLAVEALWDQVKPVGDWEALLDLLLLDHSAGDDLANSDVPVAERRNKNKKTVDDSAAGEAWRLEEVEEAVLLEVFVSALQKAKADGAGTKKGENETITSDITRALIKGLPRLITKHQSDENRIADVLLIPQLMNLDMFLEMRMITAYASLWDEVIRQFLSHSSLIVLRRTTATIRYFMDATSLSNTNSTKILELEDELSTSLRDAIGGRDELEVETFTEDEVRALGAICARVAALAGIRDITAWMDEDEGGKQSSAWDIVSALADRGRLGYKEEELMVDQALHLLKAHIIWKAKNLQVNPDASQRKSPLHESLREQRETLFEKVVEYAVGTQSNACDGVKRTAFQTLVDLHILFAPRKTEDDSLMPLSYLAVTLDDEVQYRCAGFVQAEIERYAEEIGVHSLQHEGTDDGTSQAGDSDADGVAVNGKKNKGAKRTRENKTRVGISNNDPKSRTTLEREYLFTGVTSHFVRAVRAGAVHPRHGAVLLANYGRLGAPFDACSKIIVDVLRELGTLEGQGDVVSSVVTQALQQSFTLLLDGLVDTEAHAVALAKLLASSFVVRGAQLSIIRRLESRHIVDIHTTSLAWICKRLAMYESNKNKKSRNTSVLFFKVLVPLLAHVEGEDTLKIKAHLDQALAHAKIEAPANSKIWEPLRAYEKRLTAIVSKGKSGRPKKGGKGGPKSHEMVTSDEDDAGDGDLEGIADELAVRPRIRPRPKPMIRRADDTEEPLDKGPFPVGTPSSQPRLKTHYRTKSHVEGSSTVQPSFANGVSPQKAPLKRARSETEETEDLDIEPLMTVEGSHLSSSGQDFTQPSEIQIQRKRIRH